MERRVLLNRSALAGSAARDAAGTKQSASPGSVRIQAGSSARSAEAACGQEHEAVPQGNAYQGSGAAGFTLRAQGGRVFQPRKPAQQARPAVANELPDEHSAVSAPAAISSGSRTEQVQQAPYPEDAGKAGTGTFAVTRWKEALRSFLS